MVPRQVPGALNGALRRPTATRDRPSTPKLLISHPPNRTSFTPLSRSLNTSRRQAKPGQEGGGLPRQPAGPAAVSGAAKGLVPDVSPCPRPSMTHPWRRTY